jgi:probable rRNA maturation factor
LVRIQNKQVAELVAAALSTLGYRDCEVTVAFVRDSAIRKLNRDFRGNDRETDVLSFPLEKLRPKPASNRKGEVSGRRDASRSSQSDGDYLGDVVISTETALRQARQSGLSIEREIDELVIHGVLHLCGYDHATDRGEMNRKELKLRQSLLDD